MAKPFERGERGKEWDEYISEGTSQSVGYRITGIVVVIVTPSELSHSHQIMK